MTAAKKNARGGAAKTGAKRQPAATKQLQGAADLVEMKITLDDVKPAVTRKLVVSTRHSLDELHDIIQTAMGWQNCHMHAFQIPGTRESFGDTSMFDGGEDMEDEEDVSIGDLLARSVKKIRYTYDFGDDWHHTITFGKAVDATPGMTYPMCTDGQGACPPEDCGGPWGYAEKLAILADPKHEDYEETREWMGPFVMPDHFSVEEVNVLLHPHKHIAMKPTKGDTEKKST
jgi:Plasmid pRiA4b ORF-3-like protein